MKIDWRKILAVVGGLVILVGVAYLVMFFEGGGAGESKRDIYTNQEFGFQFEYPLDWPVPSIVYEDRQYYLHGTTSNYDGTVIDVYDSPERNIHLFFNSKASLVNCGKGDQFCYVTVDVGRYNGDETYIVEEEERIKREGGVVLSVGLEAEVVDEYNTFISKKFQRDYRFVTPDFRLVKIHGEFSNDTGGISVRPEDEPKGGFRNTSISFDRLIQENISSAKIKEFESFLENLDKIATSFRIFESSVGLVDTSEWKTYRDDKYGFEFEYKRGWGYTVTSNIVSLYGPGKSVLIGLALDGFNSWGGLGPGTTWVNEPVWIGKFPANREDSIEEGKLVRVVIEPMPPLVKFPRFTIRATGDLERSDFEDVLSRVLSTFKFIVP